MPKRLYDEANGDARGTQMIDRIDRFREELHKAIKKTVVNGDAVCAEDARDSQSRIARSLHAVSDVTLHNLEVASRATHGAIILLLKAKLRAVGGGPSLDYTSATAFLEELHLKLLKDVRERRMN